MQASERSGNMSQLNERGGECRRLTGAEVMMDSKGSLPHEMLDGT